MKWFSDQIDKNAKPLKELQRREVVLFPPGKCVHFYRDGVGISAVSIAVILLIVHLIERERISLTSRMPFLGTGGSALYTVQRI